MNASAKILLSLVLSFSPFVMPCDKSRYSSYRRTTSLDTQYTDESSLVTVSELAELRSESSSTIGKGKRSVLDLRFGQVRRDNPYLLNLAGMRLDNLTGLEEIRDVQRACKVNCSRNKLVVVPQLALVAPRATDVDFSHNRIGRIDDKSFSGLDFLRFIDLSNNELTVFSRDAAKGLFNLIGIDLSHNKLDAVEAGTFGDNTKLRTLNLSYNKIKWVAPLTNVRLKRLLLDHNELREVSDDFFNPLVELSEVAIHHNRIPGTINNFIKAHFAGRDKPVKHVAFKKPKTYTIEELQRSLHALLEPCMTPAGRAVLLRERPFATAEGLDAIAQGMLAMHTEDEDKERTRAQWIGAMTRLLAEGKDHIVLEYQILAQCMPLLTQIQQLKQQNASLPHPITNTDITRHAGDNVLHVAAACGMPLVLDALLKVFPQYMRAKNAEGVGALGCAADSLKPGTMAVLCKRLVQHSFCPRQALEGLVKHIAQEGASEDVTEARRALLWSLTAFAHEGEHEKMTESLARRPE